MVGGRQVASLFLEPDNIGPYMLRGRMFILEADDQPAVPVRSPWRIRDSYSYACIPMPGRQPGELQGSDDLGWPFIVQGELDDDTLISVVTFIRNEPRIPMENWRGRQVARAPISVVRRQDDAISVSLRPRDHESEYVWLTRKAGRWVITKFERAIV